MCDRFEDISAEARRQKRHCVDVKGTSGMGAGSESESEDDCSSTVVVGTAVDVGSLLLSN